ncbi:hypothetical protein TELCIR_23770, partial [Teladorsagia circumcincta]
TSTITYFVIDCRSNEAYNSGHIYGSFNLDCKLLVDAPSQFEMALSCLESYKHEQKFDEHICFFGYGDEDQKLVGKMKEVVISKSAAVKDK